MTKIVVSHNFQRIEALLTGLADKKAIQRAVSRSIKRTLTSVRKAGSTEIRAKRMLRLSAAELKQKVHSYDEAKASKPVEAQYGKIWFGSRGESLGKFYARRVVAGRSKVLMRQDKYGAWQGVRLYAVRLNRYGAPYLTEPKRSFLVEKGGGKVVFKREGSARTPIEKLRGPSMAKLVDENGILRRIQAVARNRYVKEFDRNVKFYAEKAVRKSRDIK